MKDIEIKRDNNGKIISVDFSEGVGCFLIVVIVAVLMILSGLVDKIP